MSPHGTVRVGFDEFADALRDPDAFLIASKLSQTDLDRCGPDCDIDCVCDSVPYRGDARRRA